MTVLSTLAIEFSSVVTHMLRYPTGLRCPRMTANLADRTGGSVGPIVLLPGLADNMAVFTRLRTALEESGVGPVVAFAYSPSVGDVRSVAAKLAEQVEQLCAITGGLQGQARGAQSRRVDRAVLRAAARRRCPG